MWGWKKHSKDSQFNSFLAALDKQQKRSDDRLKQALDTIDRVIAAKFDKPVIADVEPVQMQASFDYDMNDVLTAATDEEFIEKASRLQ